jgi:hypothetical protein
MGTKSKSLALFLVALFLTSLVVLPPPTVKAYSKTIVVPDDYPTIQAAVDKTSIGDTVLVKSGTYNQNVTINKQLSLIGEEAETTILYGPRSSTIFDPSITININADNVSVSGFTIADNMNGILANGNGIQVISNVFDSVAGIVLTGSFGTIADNTATFRPPYSTHNGPITCSGSNNTISGNIIKNWIVLTGSFNKVYANSATRILLEDADSNTVSNNKCSALELRGGSFNIASGNILEGSSSSGIMLVEGYNNIFYGNNVTNSEYSSRRSGVGLGSYAFVQNNTFYHNNFINNS